jgi:acyl-CoA thioester hydrolase
LDITLQLYGEQAIKPHLQPTRPTNNDAYCHVNDVVYYSWFDTAVNRYMIDNEALDIQAGSVIGLVVATSCAYFTPIAFLRPVRWRMSLRAMP